MPNQLILCIDDEKPVLDTLSMQLKTEFGNRYIFEFAESANEGLQVIDDMTEENVEIAIVISDWLMPEIKGDEFFIILHKRFPNTTKVLLTGQADLEAIERAKSEANLFKCIHKPWDDRELIKIISSSLK